VSASGKASVAQAAAPLLRRSEAGGCDCHGLIAQPGKHGPSSNVCPITGRAWVSARGWMTMLAGDGPGRKAWALPVCLICLPGFPCPASGAFLARGLHLKLRVVTGSRDARAGEALAVTPGLRSRAQSCRQNSRQTV